jgi:hypothetical protein
MCYGVRGAAGSVAGSLMGSTVPLKSSCAHSRSSAVAPTHSRERVERVADVEFGQPVIGELAVGLLGYTPRREQRLTSHHVVLSSELDDR